MSEIYTKPPLSISEQVELLDSRGLIIGNKAKAEHYLSFISYYRLSGYAIAFEKINQGKREHQFKPGTTFEDILYLYNFDRLLRLLVMDAIERIEVAVRTQICLKLALIYQDSHWYMRDEIFTPTFNFEKFLGECRAEFAKSKEVFVRHYRSVYYSPELPPSWMIIELLSLGTWSHLYKNLANRRDKKQVSDVFELSPVELESWLHALTYIRNLCAHHARLWNRHFTITPTPKLKYRSYLMPGHTFATQAAMIHIMLNIITPNSGWVTRLIELLAKHPNINLIQIGFLKDWHQDAFWNNK